MQSAPAQAAPPASTVLQDPHDGDCPYLDADLVSLLTGQGHGQTQIVPASPTPLCIFVRSDGGALATVRIIEAPTPASALAAVDQHVPVAGSQPATQPSGWSGGSRSHGPQVADAPGAGSVYAVAKGRFAVVVEENEAPSIKARSLAVCAIFGAALQSGDPPDYCLTPG